MVQKNDQNSPLSEAEEHVRGLNESEINVAHVLEKYEKKLSIARSSAQVASQKLENIINNARERRKDRDLKERAQLTETQMHGTDALTKQTAQIEAALLQVKNIGEKDQKK